MAAKNGNSATTLQRCSAPRTASLQCSKGGMEASNVKVEQVSGLPFLEIKIDKGEIARRGLNLSDVRM